MKTILLTFLLGSFTNLVWAQNTIDPVQSLQFDTQARTYTEKIKNADPDKAVSFITNRLNTKYVDLKVVDIDRSDMANRKLRINRATNSTRLKLIDSCSSEFGPVEIYTNYIIVTQVDKFPVRVRCLGESGNYREVFATFKQ